MRRSRARPDRFFCARLRAQRVFLEFAITTRPRDPKDRLLQRHPPRGSCRPSQRPPRGAFLISSLIGESMFFDLLFGPPGSTPWWPGTTAPNLLTNPSGPAAPSQALGQLSLPPPPQSPSLASGLPLVSSNAFSSGATNNSVPTAAPMRSVLFSASSSPTNAGAFGGDPANQDQASQSLVSSGLPISKSGAPFFPPPPQLSNPRDQALAAARLVAPNLVDYFTKPLPPPLPFPATPGKIPSGNFNPTPEGRSSTR